jgi:hypothetical protein
MTDRNIRKSISLPVHGQENTTRNRATEIGGKKFSVGIRSGK